MNSRLFAVWMTTLCAGSALAIGLFDDRTATAAAHDPPMPVPVLQSAEPASPTVTPLPPPPMAPPDAAGIAHTTPPLGIPSPKAQPTIPLTLWLSAGDSSTVPIALHGGRPFVPVVVDGVRRDFLLGGTGASTLDASLHFAGAAGTDVVRTLQIGDVRLTNVKVTQALLAAFSQTYLGAAAAGIVGSELFSRYPVTIDYPNRTLTIYRTESAAAGARAATAMVTPLEVVAGAPAVACAIDGKSAAPCLLDVHSDADVMLSGAGWSSRNARAIAMRDAEPGREMRGVTVRARTLTIGSLAVAGPLLDVASDDRSSAGQPSRATLGSGILSRFAITIDEPGGVLVVSAGTAATASASRFDGSGLWLVWRGNAAVVRSVVRRSPADVAGLAAGDVIVAVDGTPIGDLDSVRDKLMQPTGTQVALTYARGARRRDVTIALRSLL